MSTLHSSRDIVLDLQTYGDYSKDCGGNKLELRAKYIEISRSKLLNRIVGSQTYFYEMIISKDIDGEISKRSKCVLGTYTNGIRSSS